MGIWKLIFHHTKFSTPRARATPAPQGHPRAGGVQGPHNTGIRKVNNK